MYEKVCLKAGALIYPEKGSDADKALTEADRKELEAIPFADVQFTHSVKGMDKKAKEDSYYGTVYFDAYSTRLRFPLDKNGTEFMIAYSEEGKTYVPAQFKAPRRVRLVRVHFAGGNVVPMCEVFAASGLVVAVRLYDRAGQEFCRLLRLMAAKDVDGFAKKWAWFDRDAFADEKVDAVASEEAEQ